MRDMSSHTSDCSLIIIMFIIIIIPYQTDIQTHLTYTLTHQSHRHPLYPHPLIIILPSSHLFGTSPADYPDPSAGRSSAVPSSLKHPHNDDHDDDGNDDDNDDGNDDNDDGNDEGNDEDDDNDEGYDDDGDDDNDDDGDDDDGDDDNDDDDDNYDPSMITMNSCHPSIHQSVYLPSQRSATSCSASLVSE